jgi:hypothetical protein
VGRVRETRHGLLHFRRLAAAVNPPAIFSDIPLCAGGALTSIGPWAKTVAAKQPSHPGCVGKKPKAIAVPEAPTQNA